MPRSTRKISWTEVALYSVIPAHAPHEETEEPADRVLSAVKCLFHYAIQGDRVWLECKGDKAPEEWPRSEGGAH